ncbi:transmembrane protein 62 [Galendromus occidentalis]|uniref:Transmembrane protein 62 n=1 Tax=Galendromus occidentalis TaxID=34638 RepID=A0AAJ7L8C7_9ACAR|nr:transmembrane protein 62 [Galendromus occidentalis]
MSRNGGALLLFTGFVVCILLMSIGDQRSRQVQAEPSSAAPKNGHTVFPDDRYRRLHHFVQVTDLHVSMYRDSDRLKDFSNFIEETLLQVIKPPVVIMSGDIVDSLGASFMSSEQNLKEWLAYRKILDDTKVTEKITWLDIRGNHDNLNLESVTAENNYYRKYSVRGPQNNYSYKYIYDKDDEKIAFVGVDTCMDPGSRRPFNFFGHLTRERFDEVMRLKEETSATNYTIWFGHHPSSVVFGRSKQGLSFRDVFANSGPYLCGHYHTVFNVANEMYYMHTGNALELELGDFKKNRKYRILSYDNGLLNFVDVRFGKFPVILVTNPKNALYHMPEYEPLYRIAQSTHIRVLVFSDEADMDVKVKLNDEEEQFLTRVDKTPLFIFKWNSSKYAHGLHRIQVAAEDGQGRKNSVSFQFSVDGSRPSFNLIPRIVLSLGRDSFIFGYAILTVISLGPLVFLRYRYGAKIGRLLSREGSSQWRSRLMFQLALLASIDRLLFPLIIFPFYVAFGPWFAGFMVAKHLSICFMWGSYVNASFIPGGIIHMYAVILLFVYFLPFIVLLSSRVLTTYAQHFQPTLCEDRVVKALRTLSLFCLVVYQLVWASWFWFAFGWTAVVFGFVPTGGLIFTAVLWRMATVLPRNIFCLTREDNRAITNSSLLTGSTENPEAGEDQSLVTSEQVKLNLKDN